MSADQSDPKEAAAHLLAYLRKLKNDRGAMADLRCALNPTKLPRAWPLLARVGGIGNPRIETVAGLVRLPSGRNSDRQSRNDLLATSDAENNSVRRPIPPIACMRPRRDLRSIPSRRSCRQGQRDSGQLRRTVR